MRDVKANVGTKQASSRRLSGRGRLVGVLVAAALVVGCTSPREYLRNGFKVGPNYRRPAAATAESWIDERDQRLRSESADDSQWWTVLKDPALNSLIENAYQQNLTVREVGFRVLAARARLGVAVGEFFPQTQDAGAGYARQGISSTVANRVFTPQRFFNIWNAGFNLAWELDFWGRFRRAIEETDALWNASIEDYDAALVTLLGDVAANYVKLRTFQARIALAEANVKLQKSTLDIVEVRFKNGVGTDLDVQQARTNLAQTEASIPPLQISLRQANNRLCILLGIPPEELERTIGPAPIPTAPIEVAIGIPGELLQRRPDVRRAERILAAQSARIGIAASQLYPQISLIGTIGLETSVLHDLFQAKSFIGDIGPSLRWNILNYGRILNSIRVEDALFQELAVRYQNTVLRANEEVENGLVSFLQSQEQVKSQGRAVDASRKSVDLVLDQLREGKVDFNRVFVMERDLVQQQDLLAQAQGNVVLGLIEIYRALGGGWQIRFANNAESNAEAPSPPQTPPAPVLPEGLPGPQHLPSPPGEEETSRRVPGDADRLLQIFSAVDEKKTFREIRP